VRGSCQSRCRRSIEDFCEGDFGVECNSFVNYRWQKLLSFYNFTNEFLEPENNDLGLSDFME